MVIRVLSSYARAHVYLCVNGVILDLSRMHAAVDDCCTRPALASRPAELLPVLSFAARNHVIFS